MTFALSTIVNRISSHVGQNRENLSSNRRKGYEYLFDSKNASLNLSANNISKAD